MKRVLNIVTGDIQSGKTSFIISRYNELKNIYACAGVLAPAVWDNNEKIGIDNILLPNEKRFQLATKNFDTSNSYSKKWKFDEHILQAVNKHFSNIKNYDILFVDELGPLEFEKNQGLTNAIELLKTVPCEEAYIVVRSYLVDIAIDIFKMWDKIEVIDIK